MHTDFIKIITGIRRVGKSYLLNEIFYRYLLSLDVGTENIIQITLDNEGIEVESINHTIPKKFSFN